MERSTTSSKKQASALSDYCIVQVVHSGLRAAPKNTAMATRTACYAILLVTSKLKVKCEQLIFTATKIFIHALQIAQVYSAPFYHKSGTNHHLKCRIHFLGGGGDSLYYIRKTLGQVGEVGVEGGIFEAWDILKINRSS